VTPTRVDEVVAALRTRILQGGLGPGERLVEVALTEQLGVGRSTVREALQRLALLGFLDGGSHRGYAVRAFTTDDAVRIGEVFALLEQRAAQSVTRPLPDDVVTTMREAAEEMRALVLPRDIDRSCELDRTFHGAFVNGCSNPWIVDAWRRQGPLLHVMVIPIIRSGISGTGAHQAVRHLELLRVIGTGTSADVSAAIDTHYRQPPGQR
jgi:DNA-binding GntR family transcriptional regulator